MRQHALYVTFAALLMCACFLLSACGSTTTLYERQSVAPELMQPCMDLVLAAQVGWIEAHAHNIEAYMDCRTRYESLIEAVK